MHKLPLPAALLLSTLALALHAPPSARAGLDPEDRCVAAKSKAVGSYFLCLQKARAAAVASGTQPDTSACEETLARKWAQAEEKAGALCPDGVTADDVRSALSGCAGEVAGLLTGAAKPKTCGDGAINVLGEECDGTDLGAASCTRLGFDGGLLQCTSACRLDSSGCTNSMCSPGSDGYEAPAGCSCKPTWSSSGQTICNGGCANPDGDVNGPWCFTSATCNGQNWAYCVASTSPTCEAGADGYAPPAGCGCRTNWSYGGHDYCDAECANPDDDPNGPWCFTEGSCNGQNWTYCTR